MKKNNKIKTNYGWKKEGNSKFVIVAPHTTEYHENIEKISELIAKKLDAYLVINNRYRRNEPFEPIDIDNFIIDFNSVSGFLSYKPIGEFYSDVWKYADKAIAYGKSENYNHKQSMIVYLQGMNDFGDIGIGIETGAVREYFARNHQISKGPESDDRNPNVIYRVFETNSTFKSNIDMTNNLCQELEKSLVQKLDLRSNLEEDYDSDSNLNGVMFCKRRAVKYITKVPNDSIKIKICDTLRERYTEYSSSIIADNLEKAYENL